MIAMPGPSSSAVALVVAVGHYLGDEVQILVLVVPRGRGGCGGRPVRVGHVSGRNDSVRIFNLDNRNRHLQYSSHTNLARFSSLFNERSSCCMSMKGRRNICKRENL